jgi:hypothetical protein
MVAGRVSVATLVWHHTVVVLADLAVGTILVRPAVPTLSIQADSQLAVGIQAAASPGGFRAAVWQLADGEQQNYRDGNPLNHGQAS